MFVTAKGSFQPSHPSSTQHRALLSTPAEGQNGSYLPAARDFPDVHPHVVATDSKALHGAQLMGSVCREVPSPWVSFGGDALGDDRLGEGEWKAGVNLQGDLVQLKHSRVEG